MPFEYLDQAPVKAPKFEYLGGGSDVQLKNSEAGAQNQEPEAKKGAFQYLAEGAAKVVKAVIPPVVPSPTAPFTAPVDAAAELEDALKLPSNNIQPKTRKDPIIRAPNSSIAEMPKGMIGNSLQASSQSYEGPTLPPSKMQIGEEASTAAALADTQESVKKLGKFGGYMSAALFHTLLNPVMPEKQKMALWEEVKKAGDEAPLEEVSKTMELLAMAYGGYEVLRQVPGLLDYLKGSKIGDFLTEKYRMATNRERGLEVISDEDFASMYKEAPEYLRTVMKRSARSNPQLQRVIGKMSGVGQISAESSPAAEAVASDVPASASAVPPPAIAPAPTIIPEGRRIPLNSVAGAQPTEGPGFTMKPNSTPQEIERVRLYHAIRSGLDEAFTENLPALVPPAEGEKLMQAEFEKLLPQYVPEQVVERAVAEGRPLTDIVSEQDMQRMKTALTEKFGAVVSEAENSFASPERDIPAANPELEVVKQNYDAFREEYRKRAQALTGSPDYLSSDLAKYVEIPDKLGPFKPELSISRQDIGRHFVKTEMEKSLADPARKDMPILITAGGTGAGKTTALKNFGKAHPDLAKQYLFEFDTNLADYDLAKSTIDKFLASSPTRVIEVKFVERHPVKAFKEGVYPRFHEEGRVVPIESHLHFMGAKDSVIKLYDTYKGNPRVTFNFYDNNGKIDEAFPTTVDKIRELRYNKGEYRRQINEFIQSETDAGRLKPEHAALFRDQGDARTAQSLHSGSRSRTQENPAREVKDEPQSFAAPNSPNFTTTAQRIPVAPLTGVAPKPINQIIFDVSKALGRKVSYGRPSPGAGGTYYPGSAATVIKYAGDLDTTAHELAHALDDRFGIVASWNKPGFISNFDNELSRFWQHGSVQSSGPKSSLAYRRAEGVAEWVRAWIVNPKAAEASAPKFSQYVKSHLPPSAVAALRNFSQDIRAFAGAPAHEQIMANTSWKPPESGILDFFSGKKTGAGFHLTWGDRLQAALQDDLKAFTKAVDFAKGEKGIGDMLPADDPQIMARIYSGIHAKMDDIFEKGMVNSQNKRVTPGGVNWIFEPLDRTDAKTLEREAKEVVSFMIAEKTIEKAAQLGKIRISGIGGGIVRDTDVAHARIRELSANPAKLARVKETAARYRTWSRSIIEYMVEKGRMSRKDADQIYKDNEYYVAMQRVMETAPGEEVVPFRGKGGGKLGSAAQPIQKFQGSTREIQNPFTSLMEATYRGVREADRNEVLQSFRDLLTGQRGMSQGQVQDLASVGRKVYVGDKNAIPIYVDGKKELWQFHADVHKALKGIVEGNYLLPGWMTFFPKLMRAGITQLPPFALRNFLRDAQEQTVVSDVGRGILDSFKKRGPMDISNLRLFGGDQAGHYLRDRVDYMRAMEAALKDMAKNQGNIIVPLEHLGRAYKKIMESSELAGRTAEYRAAFRHAKNVLKYDDYNAGLFAAAKARGALDFAVAGHVVRVINQIIPFTNAGIQGNVRMAKSFAGNPGGFAGRWALYILAPVAFERLYNSIHNEKEYEQLPAYQKDMFFNFKIGPNTWLKIPKPFFLGVMGSAVTRSIDAGLGIKHPYEGFGRSISSTLLPVDENALSGSFQGVAQATSNYDWFRNRAIVPRHEEKLDLDLRNTKNASRFGQTLQRVIGVDARKIDFVMQAQFGYAGKLVSDLSDVGRKDRPGLLSKQTGMVTSSPAFAARDVQWVMNTAAARGIESRPEYKAMQSFLNTYWNASNNDGKDIAAKRLTDYATKVREIWEKTPAITGNARRAAKVSAIR